MPEASKLSDDEIAIIKGMLARGDKQSDIAAWFSENSGRIAEINTGTKSLGERARHIKKANANLLPPPGPYTVHPR